MTLKCIAGIEKPDEGKIILNNKVLFDSKKGINLPPQDRKVGLLFQSYALFPNMTLYENISIGIRGNIKKDNKVKEIIDRFSLNKLKNHYPHQLSGGEQQRVALARMIINEPEIFMLDEPFSALDEYLRWNIIEWIAELMERENTPTILVSHDKNEIYRLSDTVAILKNGKIVEENTKKNIFNNPSSVYSANLIGYKNISEIQFIDRDTLYVKDWNLNLNIDNYNKNARYIGINQQNINLKLKGKNTFTFLVVDKIINYDHVMLLLKNNEEQKRPIYMKVDNGNKFSINDRIRISLDKENINLFNR